MERQGEGWEGADRLAMGPEGWGWGKKEGFIFGRGFFSTVD